MQQPLPMVMRAMSSSFENLSARMTTPGPI
jgi:hypothetical protein